MKRGFTLIELLVVIVIIGILATIATAVAQEYFVKTKVSKAMVELTEIRRSAQVYYLDTGLLPPDCKADCEETSDPLYQNVGAVSNWRGPYLEGGIHSRVTPWGGAYGLWNTDSNGDGLMESWALLSADTPGAGTAENLWPISLDELELFDIEIDKNINPNEGNFQYGPAQGYQPGEGGWFIGEA